ncbi:MAG: hypothetical protein IJJ00_07485 [Erysipelotrichaceae bacterium]|nr:hypothetical protein [Erysipelotrichaceae bacterium]
MKSLKKITVLLFVAVLLMAAGCAKKDEPEPIVGGWSEVEDGTITEELQQKFDKAIEGLTGVGYVPLELLETQIVAGTNYKFLCDATPVYQDAETKKAIVTIYEDLEGNLSILDIEDVEE